MLLAFCFWCFSQLIQLTFCASLYRVNWLNLLRPNASTLATISTLAGLPIAQCLLTLHKDRRQSLWQPSWTTALPRLVNPLSSRLAVTAFRTTGQRVSTFKQRKHTIRLQCRMLSQATCPQGLEKLMRRHRLTLKRTTTVAFSSLLSKFVTEPMRAV